MGFDYDDTDIISRPSVIGFDHWDWTPRTAIRQDEVRPGRVLLGMLVILPLCALAGLAGGAFGAWLVLTYTVGGLG